jgi:hypothetical protein
MYTMPKQHTYLNLHAIGSSELDSFNKLQSEGLIGESVRRDSEVNRQLRRVVGILARVGTGILSCIGLGTVLAIFGAPLAFAIWVEIISVLVVGAILICKFLIKPAWRGSTTENRT